MMARDRGIRLPAHVVAVYPIAQPDTTTNSYSEEAFAKPLSRAGMSWFFGWYTPTETQRRDPRIDLVHANLRGLPPVTIVNAQIDPLRDDGAMLEQALRSAGVPVTRRVWDGVTHEFFGLTPVVDKAAEAQQWAADRLKQVLGR
jgi:acetyl esterase/lipase